MLPALAIAAPGLSPATDPRFAVLPLVERERISLLLGLFARFECAKRGQLGLMQAEAAAQLRHRKGFAAGSLDRHYQAWLRAGRDWTAVIDKARVPQGREAGVPEEFVRHLVARCEGNRRKHAPEFRRIQRDFESGVPVPGYGTWQEWFARTYPGHPVPPRCQRLPDGWSVKNLYTLMDKHTSRASLALARQGYAAATPLTPTVVRSARDLGAMHMLAMDDFKLDFLVQLSERMEVDGEVFEAGGIYPAAGLALMCIGSRKVLKVGVKLQPKVAGKDGKERRLAVSRTDTAFLLGMTFAEHGIPADKPCVVLLENASATLTTAREKAMSAVFGERVRIAHTGLFKDTLIPGGWVEGGGKPWSKGWIESFFNLLWNELGSTRGYKGASYAQKPGELEAQLREAGALLREALATDPRVVKYLQFGFLEFREAVELVTRAVDLLNNRTWHDIQDLDIVREYRLSPTLPPVPEHALAGLPREVLLSAKPVTRRESPEERWRKLAATTPRERVPAEHLAIMLSDGFPVRPQRGAIRFQRGGVQHVFFSGDTAPEILAENVKWTAHWAPECDPDTVYLYRPDTLAFVAAVPRLRAVNPLDAEACGEVAGETKRALNRLVSEHRARHTDLADANRERREHNARVLNAARVARLPDLSEGDAELSLAAIAPHERFAAPAAPALRRERRVEPGVTACEQPKLTRI